MTDYDQVDILLVEESEIGAEMTVRALGRHNLANNLVWVKGRCRSARLPLPPGRLCLAPERPPKLVLLDLKMPKLDGIEVLRQIKADERTKAIQVVMLTSIAEERGIISSYSLGVNRHVMKVKLLGSYRRGRQSGVLLGPRQSPADEIR
jgi:two-component system, response regulator